MDEPEVLEEIKRLVMRLRRDGRMDGVEHLGISMSNMLLLKRYGRRSEGVSIGSKGNKVSVSGCLVRTKQGLGSEDIVVVG